MNNRGAKEELKEFIKINLKRQRQLIKKSILFNEQAIDKYTIDFFSLLSTEYHRIYKEYSRIDNNPDRLYKDLQQTAVQGSEDFRQMLEVFGLRS